MRPQPAAIAVTLACWIMMDEQWRTVIDADVTLADGGGLQTQGFRLDPRSVTSLLVSSVGTLLVRHLGLLLVGEVGTS